MRSPRSNFERLLRLILVLFIAFDIVLIIPTYASELRLDLIHSSLPRVSLESLRVTNFLAKPGQEIQPGFVDRDMYIVPTGAVDPAPTPMPSPTPVVYIVQPGDVLGRIARSYGTTADAIAAANGISNPNMIFVGQKLVIPVSPMLTNEPEAPTATLTYTPIPFTLTNTGTPQSPAPTSTNTSVVPSATLTDTPIPPTPTHTNTSQPLTPAATNTPLPPSPTHTNTPVVPTATLTDTSVPTTAAPTYTPVPPTATSTSSPLPPTPSNTPLPPTPSPSNTSVPATPAATDTHVAPTATLTDTPVPHTPTHTSTPLPPTPSPSNTPLPATPTATDTPVAPTATLTYTPVPSTSTPTNTPLPPSPTHTSTPVPSYTPTSTAVPTEPIPSMTPTKALIVTATVVCGVATPGCQASPTPTSTPTSAPTASPSPTLLPTHTQTSIPVPTHSGPVPAFPGAEGWGAGSVGGRGGRVIEVTNLNDSGPGSFRAAVEAEEPRIVIFKVSGVINLSDSIYILHPYVTIAGQTAPGSGIVLRGKNIVIRSHDVIMRHITYRGTGQPSDDTFFVVRADPNGTHDIIIDHCSGSWAYDDLISINHNSVGSPPIYNVTVQNCVFGYPNHEHPTTLLIASNSGWGYLRNISVHDNLFSTSGHRNPQVDAQHVEVINNVIYNFRHRVGDIVVSEDQVAGSEVDYISNYLYRGPASGDRFFRWDDRPDIQNDIDNPLGSIYMAGNIAPVAGGLLPSPLSDPGADNWDLITYYGDNSPLSRVHQRNSRLTQPAFSVSVDSANAAFQTVLEVAGNYRHLNSDGSWTVRRDVVDSRLISEVRNNSGPNDYSDVGRPGDIGAVDSGTPYLDTDHDGMSDQWELAYCFDSADATDGPQDSDGDGYTNVEEFLNGTRPRSNSDC